MLILPLRDLLDPLKDIVAYLMDGDTEGLAVDYHVGLPCLHHRYLRDIRIKHRPDELSLLKEREAVLVEDEFICGREKDIYPVRCLALKSE